MDAKRESRSFREELEAIEAELRAQDERVAGLMREHRLDARDLEAVEVPEAVERAFVASIEPVRAPPPSRPAPVRGFVVRG